ncbi:hypothetical protein [Sporichthya sp.]|uniref:hypothetical protein n=1 Tax=Sporichthya sp. TaxID=65475 RepID=UPI0017E0E507|nr:hypothetical protein [Sporichthya sp.]MBA3744636.1 hypothetical protein [Sporichthya sp.]
MYALLIEVNANDSHVEQARKALPEMAVPMAKEMGAVSGVWLAPGGTDRGISMTVFNSEQEARQAASQFTVGQPMGPVEGVTARIIEVREVLAQL